MRTWISNILLILTLACCSIPGFAEAQSLTIGKTVPDWTLKTLDGKTVKLSDYKGKTLVLAFLVHGSGACHSFAPKLEKDIWQAYKKKNVVVLGVFVRSRRARQFHQMHGLTFSTAIDTKLARMFPSDGYPYVAVLDGERKFRFSTRGVEPAKMIPSIIKALQK